MKKKSISRRNFLSTAATATAGISIVPFNFSFTPQRKKPNSKVNGVQLGLTTYSYLRIPHSLEEVLEYTLKAGVNAVEMRGVLEEGLGIPSIPRGGRGGNSTDTERAEAARAAQEKQKQWRLSLPMQKYADVRKMYNDAGVDIHIAKFAPARWSDEELDYAYKAAAVLGAYGITDESFAVNLTRFRNSNWDWRQALVVNQTANLAWIASSIVGAYSGQFIPAGAFGIDYALIAMFLCLLVLQLRGRLYALTAIVAGVLAVCLALVIPGNSYVVLASVLAASIGVVCRRKGILNDQI